MITQEQAERIAGQIAGPQHEAGWELVEFDAGWLVRERPPAGGPARGTALRVIERQDGRVVRFPSSVPPGRILADYAQVIDRGRPESPA